MDRILIVVVATGATALLAIVVAGILIVSFASSREDSAGSLSGRAPGHATRASRRLLAVDPGGFIFSVPLYATWQRPAVLVLVGPGLVGRGHVQPQRARLEAAARSLPPAERDRQGDRLPGQVSQDVSVAEQPPERSQVSSTLLMDSAPTQADVVGTIGAGEPDGEPTAA